MEYISAHFLRSGGSVVIFMVRVDPDTIHLVGRWWSDTIIRYLHTMAKSFTKGL